MLTYEEFETLVNGVRESINETDSALISDNLLNILSAYKLVLDGLDEINQEVSSLKNEKDELLKVNGQLFQKIGIEKEEEELIDEIVEDVEIAIEDIIDEKGGLI